MRIAWAVTLLLALCATAPADSNALVPDGRRIAPAGFTVPVEGFASQSVLSPDGNWLAVLALDRGAIDIIGTHDSILASRLVVPHATGLAWTTDGFFVSGGYTGEIARFAYDAKASQSAPVFTKRSPLDLGPGLLNGIAEDPKTHRVFVARTAAQEVVVLDDSGTVAGRYPTTGQPFDVGIAGTGFVASLYDSDHVDAWPHGGARLSACRRVRIRRACSWPPGASSLRTPMVTTS